MTTFAIIGVGGKQYRVAAGDVIQTEKVEGEAGKTVKLQHVFLTSDGKDAKVGSPLVEGASVEAKIVETKKGDKVRVFKMKPRKRYRIERGHRQLHTQLEIVKING